RLSQAADAIAGGELDIRLTGFEGRDEVSRLGRDFDQMARSLAEERRKQDAAEAALFAEKERAQVTLMSIGDAVVVTDVAGRIDFLNPVAEELTGWTTAEARGRPLEIVFRIINETTRAAAVNPVDLVLREGRVVGLANHTVLIRRDGTELNIDDSAAPIRDRDGRIIGVVLVFHDVTQAHEMARKMSWAATHDALTSLINRGEFERRLQALVKNMEAGKHHALLYLDLDQFKVVNDTCGHAAGDQLLCQLAFLMQEHVREADTLARLGGDEFGVLLANCPAPQALRVAEQLLEAVRGFRFAWEDKSFVIGASIGLVEIAGDGLSVANVLAAADTACYAAKDQGRNRVQAYSSDDSGVIRRYGEMHWVGRINRAIEENRFRLYYQPIVPLQEGGDRDRGHGEVLLRMLDEEGNVVLPNSFLPAAERYDLIQRVDRWVISSALAWMTGHELSCSINLSGQSIGDDRFLEFVIEQVRSAGIAPERICFEITETAAIANLARAAQFMSQLRERGCRFALDDFGSGLSSFGYLRNLPVDYLKIDGAFVRQVDRSAIDRAMVAAINNIGQVMGIRTVAEFVENEAIRDKLAAMGVDFGQGFGIALPAPIEDYPLRQAQPA
ncbi:MAG TPA: EAL domain-containing protein, partial [Rhodocyclaceae bacterium]|nr:EAL domain-containing protein [Rhodocyclaceae bacterium]